LLDLDYSVLVLNDIGPDQSPNGDWYANISTKLCFAGLWSIPKSSLARFGQAPTLLINKVFVIAGNNHHHSKTRAETQEMINLLTSVGGAWPRIEIWKYMTKSD
jgi:hypothetical protein